MMSTTEQTAEIRKSLKAHGWSSRKVSVRACHGSIYCTIKHADVKEPIVREIAMQYRDVSYCQASGDILAGGNTFVNVSWADDLLDAFAAGSGIGALGDGESMTLGSAEIQRDGDYYRWNIPSDSTPAGKCWGVRAVVRGLLGCGQDLTQPEKAEPASEVDGEIEAGTLKEQLEAFAKEDLEEADRRGSLMVCKTKEGNIEIRSAQHGRRHTYTLRVGLPFRVLAHGTAKDVIPVLASAYNVTYEPEFA